MTTEDHKITETVQYDEQTLFKVHSAIESVIGPGVNALSIITAMQNAGILFRERAAAPALCRCGEPAGLEHCDHCHNEPAAWPRLSSLRHCQSGARGSYSVTTSDPLVASDITKMSATGREVLVSCREPQPCLSGSLNGATAVVREALARLEDLHQAVHRIATEATQ